MNLWGKTHSEKYFKTLKFYILKILLANDTNIHYNIMIKSIEDH